MSLAHFLVFRAFYGDTNRVSVFGVDVEGPTAEWINIVAREVLMRFLEMWAFVTAGGLMAPKRRVTGFVLCGIAIALALLPMLMRIYFQHPWSKTQIALLRSIPGILGSVAGLITVRRAGVTDSVTVVATPGGAIAR